MCLRKIRVDCFQIDCISQSLSLEPTIWQAKKRLVKVTLESSFTMPECIFYILGNGMPFKI